MKFGVGVTNTRIKISSVHRHPDLLQGGNACRQVDVSGFELKLGAEKALDPAQIGVNLGEVMNMH